ncbi:unnamed protein product, partial [Rotaria sp. Silwood1]
AARGGSSDKDSSNPPQLPMTAYGRIGGWL